MHQLLQYGSFAAAVLVVIVYGVEHIGSIILIWGRLHLLSFPLVQNYCLLISVHCSLRQGFPAPITTTTTTTVTDGHEEVGDGLLSIFLRLLILLELHVNANFAVLFARLLDKELRICKAVDVR